jgi:predicted alpha/beta-hydrolase family hydrolase
MSQARKGKVELPSGGEVSFLLEGPAGARDLVVLAPGAGAGMTHPFMESFAGGLSAADLAVLRFDFLYTELGKKAPDRAPVLEATFEAVAEKAGKLGHKRVFLGGKSMGGRIASQVVARGRAADGLVFLGYPLHPPGKPERLRDAHLYGIQIPMLFVEGTRDPFCPLDTLKTVRSRLTASAEVAVIEDGDHSFKVRKSSGRSTEAAWEEVVLAVSSWIHRL